jgi:hypothetical protein
MDLADCPFSPRHGMCRNGLPDWPFSALDSVEDLRLAVAASTPLNGLAPAEAAARRAIRMFREQCLAYAAEVVGEVGPSHYAVRFFYGEGASALTDLESRVCVSTFGQARQITEVGEALLAINRDEEDPSVRADGLLELVHHFVFNVDQLGVTVRRNQGWRVTEVSVPSAAAARREVEQQSMGKRSSHRSAQMPPRPSTEDTARELAAAA